MAAPTRNALTDVYQITIDFIELAAPNNGDSEILSYHGMWKEQSASTWVDMNLEDQAFSGQTTLSVYDGLVEGQTYNFKVRAKNIYGFGPFSDPTDIKASSWPAKA